MKMNKSHLRFLAPSRVTPRRARVKATRSQRIFPRTVSSDRLRLTSTRGCWRKTTVAAIAGCNFWGYRGRRVRRACRALVRAETRLWPCRWHGEGLWRVTDDV